MRLPLNRILKRFISSDFTFYYLYGDIYFSMVITQATRIRMILRKTPLKVYSNLKLQTPCALGIVVDFEGDHLKDKKATEFNTLGKLLS